MHLLGKQSYSRGTSLLPKFFACVILSALAMPSAHAVVIAMGDGSGNTRPPPDDPGWANIGRIQELSGVFLGNHWVLTARHVGVHPIELAGSIFEPIQGRLPHFIKTTAKKDADLLLFQIRGQPDLPPLKLASNPPRIYQPVVMIGHGLSRQPQLMTWRADWSRAKYREHPPYEGFQNAGKRTMRWGTNRIAVTDARITTGPFVSLAFATTFDAGNPTPFEAQAAAGDSGGAVFAKNLKGEWELIGIMTNIWQFKNQPSKLSIYGNKTMIVSVFAYRDQIEEIINSSPDFDADGILDVDDNCARVANPEQSDRDGNGVGDLCDEKPANPH